ncbi:catalase [Trichonephila clavipes]|nr:catalase [Trichonephila clavipes]
MGMVLGSESLKIASKEILIQGSLRISYASVADGLARKVSHEDSTQGACLTFSEIVTRIKQDISSSWMQAFVHEWYEGNRPGAVLLETSSKRDETTLTRLLSGHTRVQWHVTGLKVPHPCLNCNVI